MPAALAVVGVFFLALAIDAGVAKVRERDVVTMVAVSVAFLACAMFFAGLAWWAAH